MYEFDQVAFDVAEFANNPEPRCPCVLLLDTSTSMRGQPLQELLRGFADLKEELLADPLAAKRVEISVVTFGPVRVACDFSTPDVLQVPVVDAHGDTPLGAAIVEALQLVEQRKAAYRTNGISWYRPWIFLLTDGSPTDHWKEASERIRLGETSRSFAFFAVGVEGADFNVLRALSVREPLRLRGLRFREMFRWLSNSLRTVSQSRPGDSVPLDNPTTPNGWAILD
jgi:uncharacterized protein YegL